jgi:hypothetical protein
MKNLQQVVIDLHYIASTLPQDEYANIRLRQVADELHEYVNADLQTRNKIVTEQPRTYRSVEDRLAPHSWQQKWVKNVRKTEY